MSPVWSATEILERGLATKGARVVLAVRSRERGQASAVEHCSIRRWLIAADRRAIAMAWTALDIAAVDVQRTRLLARETRSRGSTR